jgi:hypothetical protein
MRTIHLHWLTLSLLLWLARGAAAQEAWTWENVRARKIAAITLTLWKKGASFDAKKLKPQAA